MVVLEPGWLKRQLDKSAAEVATWPRWMRRAVGMTEPTTTHSGIDLAEGQRESTPGPWYYGENYLIGGWWVYTDRDDPERTTVSDMVTYEADARLIADAPRLLDERDDLKESLRTTRLEQAAKAFQVDELESQVERLTAEHEKDRQAWMAENTSLLTRVAELEMALRHIRDFRIDEEQPDRVGASSEMRVLAKAVLAALGEATPKSAPPN